MANSEYYMRIGMTYYYITRSINDITGSIWIVHVIILETPLTLTPLTLTPLTLTPLTLTPLISILFLVDLHLIRTQLLSNSRPIYNS